MMMAKGRVVPTWAPLAILTVALVLRVGLVLLHPRPLTSDELDYDELAWSLAKSGTYQIHGHPTAYRPIGYPAIVGLGYVIFGRSPIAIRLLQSVFDSFTALLLYRLLAVRDRLAGLYAGLMWAVFIPAMLFSGQMFSETIFAFLLVLLVYLLSRWAKENKSPFAAGLVLGGLVLIKPMIIIFTPILVFTLARMKSWRKSLALLTWACLPIALWLGRNTVELRTPALTTSTGINLLIGNNPQATGGYSSVPAPSSGSSEKSADSAAIRMALQYIRENPWQAAQTVVKKVLLLMSSDGELAVGNFSDAAATSGLRFRERFRSVPVWVHLLVSLPSALLLIIGTFGLATREPDMFGTVFYSLLAAILVSTIVFFGGSRFRFPLMPFLAGFAGEAIAQARLRTRKLVGWRLALPLMVCSACVLVWASEFYLIYRS
jgi:4-amino-4-deoxy-L-arabinose transferase-like glycosyltransferase